MPPNITLLALQPKCPELTPIENVWQFMRDNWLSTRIFTCYTDLIDHCCAAWNNLINRAWTIMSLGLRHGISVLLMGLGMRAAVLSHTSLFLQSVKYDYLTAS